MSYIFFTSSPLIINIEIVDDAALAAPLPCHLFVYIIFFTSPQQVASITFVMKKLLLLSLFALATLAPAAYADMSTPSAMMASSYTLAYPGMLPDNPLYKIKSLRDKILLKLTFDPQKKANLLLLQADKEYAMVPLLVKKHEVALAEKTAFKAEDAMTQLTFVYKKTQNPLSDSMYKKLNNAAVKHQEVLDGAMKLVTAQDAALFQQVENFSLTNQSEFQRLLQGNYQ